MNRISVLLFFSLIPWNVFTQSSLDDLDIIFKHNFENNTLGQYQYEEWMEDWLSPPWCNRQEELTIVQDINNSENLSKTIKLDFPANSLGPEEGGTHWWTYLPNNFEEVYLSYDVCFMPGFQFQSGGKLPSVKGGSYSTTKPTGYDGFSAGIMFKANRPAFYVYYPDQYIPEYGVTWEWGTPYTADDVGDSKVIFEYTSGAVYFTPGKWHNITYRMVLNSVKPEGGGNYDGILEAYFDGILVTQVSHILFRHTDELGIDCLRFTSFFGGDTDSWRNPIYEWLKIDNVMIYTFKDDGVVPTGHELSPTNRTINYWRKIDEMNQTVPEPPSNLRSSEQSKSSIQLRWQDNSDNEYGFRIYRTQSMEEPFVLIKTVPANTVVYNDLQLEPDTNYFYRIRSYNGKGSSNYTSVLSVSTLPLDLPMPPSQLGLVGIEKDLVILKWKDNSDNESGFEIERIGNNSISGKIGIIDANDSIYTDSNLYPNTIYTYRIRAFNNDGYSEYSNNYQIITLEDSSYLLPPNPPSSLVNKHSTSNSITIQWKDNSDNESGFVVIRTLVDNPKNTKSILLEANDTLFVDENLSPNTIYSYTVDAVNQAGISPPSNAATASTLSVAENNRFMEGLIAYYNFYYDPDNIINDISGYKDPLDLHILDPDHIRWHNNNSIEILENTAIVSDGPAKKIIDAFKVSNEITIECWIKPSEPESTSDCEIISLGSAYTDIGFNLSQRYSNPDEKSLNYVMRIQTSYTNESGYPELLLNQELEYINLQHIVYVREKDGNETLYVNGNEHANGHRPSSFDCWKDNYRLFIGNSKEMDLPWKGTLHLIAIYNNALTNTQVKNNYIAGPNDNLIINEIGYKINVNPNPVFQSEASIEIIPLANNELASNTKFRILNIYGDIFYEETIFDPSKPFKKDMSFKNYSKGLYIIQIVSNINIQSFKFVIF